METLENAITKSEIKDFIIKNKEKSVQEISDILGLSMATIRANRAWLVRDKIIEKTAVTIKGKASIKKETALKKFAETVNKLGGIYDKIRTETNNSYTNKKGEKKKDARLIMTHHVSTSGVYGVVGTLPHEEWEIEQMIEAIAPGNSYLGVERDLATHKIAKSNLRKLKKTGFIGSTHFGDISQIIYGKNEGTYGHLLLDYCGNLVTFRKEIEYAINNNLLQVNGVMAVTISKPIRGKDADSNWLLDLAPLNNADPRCASERAIETYFSKVTGFNHQVVEYFFYRDKYPMALVIIKRVK
jgi:hypothetical protein